MKNIYFYFISIILLISCSSSDDLVSKPVTPPPISPPPTEKNLEQYTPDQAKWETFLSKSIVAGNTAHDPDAITWLSKQSWDNAKWDGKTIYDPTKYTQANFAKAICPSGDQIRGLREVFYNNKPFKDNKNPTKAEVDEWHRLAINHLRALVGYTEADRMVSADMCMFARSLWGDQRQYTIDWDKKYPANGELVFGPCVGVNGAPEHCGSTFIPSATEQIPFLPKDFAACKVTAGAEGISSAPKSNIPLSIKFSRAVCGYIGAEGFWGGHVGPWFHREKFGFNFWDSKVSDQNSNAILRSKWTGNLNTSKYTGTHLPK